MEAIRKQATKLREQVARQQQAVFKQFGGGGYGGSDNVVTDEAELRLHQKLEKLYISTRAAKHFQRDIVRGVEGYIVTGSKQVEIGTKLSEDSRKYGVENTCTSGSMLSRAAKNFSRARAQMEKERGNLLKSFGTQVAEPLRAMVMGAPLEDARHLAQRYDRMRQEAEAQAVEVSKRQARVREGVGNPEMIGKLEAAESKLQDLKSNMAILGREAASAMAAVEGQQQKMTLQRLISMIESERAYHQKVLQILDQLEGEMVSERQRIEAAPNPSVEMPPPPSYEEVNNAFTSPMQNGSNDEVDYFLGEAMYAYQAESDVELTLLIGDYVVIRKVSNNGWAEGECKGKAGWFPLGYIERRERVLASKNNGHSYASIIQAKQILRRSLSNGRRALTSTDIAKGYFAVYVREQVMKRFGVPVSLLRQTSFQELLRQSEEDFGYNHPMGGLTIPCSEEIFNDLASCLGAL